MSAWRQERERQFGHGWPVRIGALLVVLGLLQPFRPAEYGPGHRGIDIVAPEAVRTPMGGEIVFAASVARVPTVVIVRGELRLTLQPVSTARRVGAKIRTGEVVGTVAAAHGYHCSGCLHLGVRLRGDYVDPLTVLPRHLTPVGISAWIQ